MECDDDGFKRASAARGRELKRKHGSGGAGVVRLAFSAAVPRAAPARAVPGVSNEHRAASQWVPTPPVHKPSDPPFMNNMDEITYWVYTKRAPCLFNYDNTLKKQADQAQPSTAKPSSVKSKLEDDHSPRKKRKLKLLDDNSVSTEKRQAIYFKTPQNQKPALKASCKSEENGSDSDFIKPPSTLKKPKNMKLPRNSQSRVPKKTKVATSTPKAVILRRSRRKAQQNISNLDSSFEIFDRVVNGDQDAEANKPGTEAAERRKSKVMPAEKGTKEVASNGQFEDLSDVSGFTANYIRSTKIRSTKRPQKLRNQNSRAPSKHSKPGDKMIMCQNKAVHTGFLDAAALNCSTDSSQNALNLLVTVRNNKKAARVNKSTSLLKFMETKEDTNANNKVNKQESKCNLNISFQSKSSGASRYPRRHKNNTAVIPEPNCSTNIENSKTNITTRRYNMRKGTLNSNQQENSHEPVIPRTRSGRRGLKLDNEESGCPVQLNSSIEQVSSSPAVNVACPNTRNVKSTTSRCLRSRTVKDKVGQVYRDSGSEVSDNGGVPCALEQSTPKCVKKVKKTVEKSGNSLGDSHRDKSGFAACFSDSDSDSVPLKQKRFFC